MALEKLDVPSVGGRCNCDHEVINVGENQTSGDGGMKGGYVNDEKGGGRWGSLGVYPLRPERTFWGSPETGADTSSW